MYEAAAAEGGDPEGADFGNPFEGAGQDGQQASSEDESTVEGEFREINDDEQNKQ
jgi:hypothetical protein